MSFSVLIQCRDLTSYSVCAVVMVLSEFSSSLLTSSILARLPSANFRNLFVAFRIEMKRIPALLLFCIPPILDIYPFIRGSSYSNKLLASDIAAAWILNEIFFSLSSSCSERTFSFSQLNNYTVFG